MDLPKKILQYLSDAAGVYAGWLVARHLESLLTPDGLGTLIMVMGLLLISLAAEVYALIRAIQLVLTFFVFAVIFGLLITPSDPFNSSAIVIAIWCGWGLVLINFVSVGEFIFTKLAWVSKKINDGLDAIRRISP